MFQAADESVSERDDGMGFVSIGHAATVPTRARGGRTRPAPPRVGGDGGGGAKKRTWRDGTPAFLADLSRDKSARACLPMGRRDSAPAQAVAGRFAEVGLRPHAPLPNGVPPYGQQTNEPSLKVHQTV
jgi:hypothetical protein